MTIREFYWSPRVNTEGDITQRVSSIQFGDGYKQETGDGIYGEQGSWPLQFVGDWDYIVGIRNFLREHKGYVAFMWRNPMFELGLYKCNGHKINATGKNAAGDAMYQLSATFETAFRP